MQVVATAGHVGHGKSTLVRALAGVGPAGRDEPGDADPEGSRPGAPSLGLEVALATLPSGERLAFVDVPGHERAVPTMLAGAGPVPAVVLAVAADEGWMPQSEEHLAAIDALGVRNGVLVVTRSDRADPRLALRQARERLARTGLRGAESVAVSAVTGAGLPELTAALDRLAGRLPVPDPDAPVRLWADRVEPGAGGAVVHGTLAAGTIRVRDELLLMPAGRRVRVRSVEAGEGPCEAAVGAARVAVRLDGVAPGRVAPGMALVTPDGWTATACVDVRTGFGEASGRLARRMTLHIGAAAVPVALRPLGPDTARLTLNTRLPLHVGDAAVLRDPARRAVARVSVLDVRPPVLVRRDDTAARARELASWPDRPGGEVVLRRHGVLHRAELAGMGCAAPPGAVRIGEWLVDPDHWEALRRRLVRLAAERAAIRPLAPGLPLERARLRLGLPARRLVEALARPPLRLAGGRVYGPEQGPPPQVVIAAGRLREELADAPFRAPDAARLAELGLTPEVLDAAERAGAVLRLGDGVVLPSGADREALRILGGLPQPFSVGQAARALGTDRRTAVALLEHLDGLGATRRVGEGRRVPGR
ncbi:selenocysteine-specific translation elongation factor [Actinomadura rubrobrunea]|uniref:Selenocysteine-specific translation elongation factor n=1 Tax=Actinomadura rubrobrunea TaxID=115335 RepID=A0A9W6UVF7_9ACTN|nr:SelB C-terminal domain-containing protein [Actinomadura rubrobrunea]GLW64999.1 selenocysteine-specific translation elongation factor [Actinomadura rubrobrunea]